MSKIDQILNKLADEDLGSRAELMSAKAELLQLVLQVIGNAPIETRGITQDPTNEKYWTKATTVRQKLIDEQRQKAYELFGKEQE